jgi:L-aspartate oxidase
VVLATGGIGNIYQFTTNPSCATGDGIAMASRAGAAIINAEFMQFHPTALFHKDIKRFLISESLRGEGARLLDPAGKPFMERYTPQAELAPRDVVARALYEEMSTLGCEYLLLDIAHYYRGSEPIEKRFSRIYETCKKGGIDITKEPIPIVPAAHYFCGGIRVNALGQTSIKRLYAVGETACTGLHGANRLASTSLLEGLYSGLQTASHLAKNVLREQGYENRCGCIPDWKIPKGAETFEPSLIYQDWKYIKLTMWNHAGIVRTKKGLERAQSDLNYHAHRITSFYREAVPTRDIIELRNAVETARIVVSQAIHNEQSIGCHYRKD